MSGFVRTSNARRSLAPALLAALLALTGASTYGQEVAAASASLQGQDERLRQRIERDFDVALLRDGLLFEPRSAAAGDRRVELTAGGFAVGGDPVTQEELRFELGVTAEPLLELVGMPPELRRELFAGAAVDEPAVEPSATAGGSLEESEAAPTRRERASRRDRSQRRGRQRDAQVVVGNSITIEEDETAKQVVVFSGRLEVKGEVLGDAAVIGGSNWVDGLVTGNAVAVGGSLHLGPSAEILGDAVSVGGNIDRDPSAIVRGSVVEVPFGPDFKFGWWPGLGAGSWRGNSWWDYSPVERGVEMSFRAFGLALLALLACLAMLLARRPVERVAWRVAEEPWKSGLVGLLAQILFLPLLVMVCVILAISIIGIPLLLLVPFAVVGVVVVAFLGYTAAVYRIGRWLEERFGWSFANPYLVLVVGIGVVHVWSLIGHLIDFGGPLRLFAAMFCVFGALIQYIVWTIGWGGALLTRFGTSGPAGDEVAVALPPAPIPSPIEDEPRPDWIDDAVDGEDVGYADDGPEDEPRDEGAGE